LVHENNTKPNYLFDTRDLIKKAIALEPTKGENHFQIGMKMSFPHTKVYNAFMGYRFLFGNAKAEVIETPYIIYQRFFLETDVRKKQEIQNCKCINPLHFGDKKVKLFRNFVRKQNIIEYLLLDIVLSQRDTVVLQ